MHERENALKEWLAKTIQQEDFILKPLAGDASFRRYFRLYYNNLSQVVMDAPPEKEALEPFLHVAHTLEKAKVLIPQILAQDLSQGFLLLRDLGDELLLNSLNTQTADRYYELALTALLKIQTCSLDDPLLPAFDRAFMIKEMNLCQEWFFQAYLELKLDADDIALWQESINWLADEIGQQPLIFIHRDYHSRNLMLVETNDSADLGVIDFQDAMSGPLTYDLVSLLKDCYISWPRAKIIGWLQWFYTRNAAAQGYTLAEFIRAFDLCGLQRHLKVLGVFSRLYLRDGKPGYLKDLPLTLKYALECSETYPELHPLFQFLQKRVVLP